MTEPPLFCDKPPEGMPACALLAGHAGPCLEKRASNSAPLVDRLKAVTRAIYERTVRDGRNWIKHWHQEGQTADACRVCQELGLSEADWAAAKLAATLEIREAKRAPGLYWWVRDEDETGMSGTGAVAQVAVFEDGTAVLRWLAGRNAAKVGSTVTYASVGDLLWVHGHGLAQTGRLEAVGADELAALEDEADSARKMAQALGEAACEACREGVESWAYCPHCGAAK